MMRSKCCVYLSALLVLPGWPACAVAQELKAAVTVRFDRPPLGELNRLVFGQNQVAYDPATYQDAPSHDRFSSYGAGLWDPVAGRPQKTVLELARRAGTSSARFPGGCGSHRYDWEKTIGDPAGRPHWRFGPDAFLRWCEAVPCEPVITLSYFAGPESAAGLVEYVNAPNDGRNPRGGTDWARRRSENGHPQPYRVRFFEVGNEDYHGDHRGVPSVSPEEYAEQFLKFARVIREVDPTVQLGAIGGNDSWNRTVLARTGPQIDFLVEHTYWPGWYDCDDGEPPAKELFRDILASPDQLKSRYQALARLLDETTGRPGRVPIAVTEYNCPLVQDRPLPYRHSLGNALFVAEMLRVLTQPGNRVHMAHFWQFANEYWGAVRGPVRPDEPGTWVRRPQFYPFQLYAEHFEKILLEVEVDCPRYETVGFGQMLPCTGEGGPRMMLSRNLLEGVSWSLDKAPGVEHRIGPSDIVEVHFNSNREANYYHASKSVRAEPRAYYLLTGTIRASDVAGGSGISLQVGDGRGWVATKSATLTDVVTGTQERRVECVYHTLPDASSLVVQVRRLSGGTGSCEVKNVRLVKIRPECFPAVPYLSVNASQSPDQGRLSLIVVNKHMDQPIHTAVRAPGFPAIARVQAWTLTGPDITANNEQDANPVAIRSSPVDVRDGALIISLPPRSCTALVVQGS
ncbi:MAG: hypothetical protein HY000_20640 [Planctomycetes bacterium]|nr:hypothetical protein [Planctomycetota bacterium]